MSCYVVPSSFNYLVIYVCVFPALLSLALFAYAFNLSSMNDSLAPGEELDSFFVYLGYYFYFTDAKMVKKISKFDIVFSSESGTYYAGQQISGKVVVELTDAMKIRGKAVKPLYNGNLSHTWRIKKCWTPEFWGFLPF